MTHVLLLNATYEPLCVLPLKRAMVLILQEKADVLVEDEDEEPVRSPSVEFFRPKVIRLRYMVRIPYRAKVALNKKNLYSRDGGQCQYCAKHVGITSGTIDHVHPRSRGGKNVWENVVLACGDCNWSKGDRLISELGWTLLKEPHVPKRQGSHIILGVMMDPAWEDYLAAA
jgi:5-methylcytosine-specific restriction endonuclease McrA